MLPSGTAPVVMSDRSRHVVHNRWNLPVDRKALEQFRHARRVCFDPLLPPRGRVGSRGDARLEVAPQ
jgi:hypothetical protein